MCAMLSPAFVQMTAGEADRCATGQCAQTCPLCAVEALDKQQERHQKKWHIHTLSGCDQATCLPSMQLQL
jgi:hypothetical protein